MAVLPTGIGPVTGYNIERSLRFNSADTAYLSRTPASASNRKTWTWSGWVKRSTLSGTRQGIFNASNAIASAYWGLEFDASEKLNIYDINSAGVLTTAAVYRDISAWYHIVVALDTTQATASNRVKLYVNGIQVTTFSAANYPSLNADSNVNSTLAHSIGSWVPAGTLYFNGYMTEVNFVDSPVLVGSTTNASTTVTLTTGTTANIGIGWNVGGTNIPSGATVSSITNSTQFVISSAATGTGSSINIGVTPPVSAFGETDSATGVWKPKKYDGTYGTNGFYLKFADNSGTTSTTLGKDSSGNGNNWTPNLFSVTAGAGNDSLVDTPTNYGGDTGVGGEVRGNYATLNPLKTPGGNGSTFNGNLNVSTLSGDGYYSATISISSGKWYAEITPTYLGTIGLVGVVDANKVAPTSYPNLTAFGWTYLSSGNKANNSSSVSYGASWAANDVIGIALDMDAGTVTFYKNGVSQGQAYSGITGDITFCCYDGSSTNYADFTCNFGQRPFEKWNGSAYVANTAPSGFKALCTQNLPPVTIGATSTTQANDYMNVVTWSGNNVTPRTISGLDFQPDFVWLKDRTVAHNNYLYDAVRGAGNNSELSSNSTGQEGSLGASEYGYVSAFTSNGFTLTGGTDPTYYMADVNYPGSNFVGWNWKANGAGSTNTAGTITSTVSANTTSGFSIVTYTGTGANATVGHGLGVAPSMVIVKARSTTSGWWTWHTAFVTAGDNDFLQLNTTGAKGSGGPVNMWNSTVPTSTVFSIGSYSDINSNGSTRVAYCFAPVAGYSAFGSYTGNNSATDGTFVYLGFRPRFLMIKSTSGSTSWVMMDSARNTYNLADTSLYAESANSEATIGTVNDIDFLSNGFKLRNNTGFVNASQTYIYAAFAEHPFKYSLAR